MRPMGQMSETMTTRSEYLTAHDVAQILNVSLVTVRNLIRKGELPATKINRRYRIARSDLAAFLENAAKR